MATMVNLLYNYGMIITIWMAFVYLAIQSFRWIKMFSYCIKLNVCIICLSLFSTSTDFLWLNVFSIQIWISKFCKSDAALLIEIISYWKSVGRRKFSIKFHILSFSLSSHLVNLLHLKYFTDIHNLDVTIYDVFN